MEIVENMYVFYQSMDIDYLKETFFILGIARKSLFKGTKPYFSLFRQEDKDLYHTIKENIVGGPSIIFTNYHQIREILVRGGNLHHNIVGYDCNALYLWTIGKEMHTGTVTGMMAQLKPSMNLMDAISMDISVNSHLLVGRKMQEG